jgi:hypothetical protein
MMLLVSMQVMLTAAAPNGTGSGDEPSGTARRGQAAAEPGGQRMPEHIDSDGDGRVSQEEFRDALSRAAPLTSPTRQGQPSTPNLQRGRRIRQYLEQQGIGVHDIPKALAVYESISMAFLYVFLDTCVHLCVCVCAYVYLFAYVSTYLHT